MKKIALFGLVLGMMLCAPVAAFADRHGHGGGHGGGGHWSGRPWHGEIHDFHGHDFDRWRGGRWYHGRHDGRDAWWWILGDLWYWYPGPVYPYPDPYRPPVIIQQSIPQPQYQPPAPQPAAPMWYYCDRPAGYYPYVSECASGWRAIPATPPSGTPR